ncbi:hypothetical protein OEA41_004030 [Lepraria neglecta]|uniref:DUF7730 domain-containing protein n=1 Tax=Lepraria neglecta TaxID=209136 RepID=A0AAD9Z5R7_9LECA|nr:hypothetical protein OEA41_004030 [Lepraria neglecta]
MKLRSGFQMQCGEVAAASNLTAAIAIHNASTPLLSLPPELKNKIYELVFGGRVVHISQDQHHDILRWDNRICYPKMTEEKAQEIFNNQKPNRWCGRDWPKRHETCHCRPFKIAPRSVRTTLLRTCRQLYNEAKYIPYSTNTFGFRSPEVLHNFISLTLLHGTDHALAIRSIMIEPQRVRHQRDCEWEEPLALTRRHFTNIEKLHVNFEQDRAKFEDIILEKPWLGGNIAAHSQYKKMKAAVLQLDKLPIKHVTVIVDDWRAYERLEMDAHFMLEKGWRWTLAEKQEWARDVKEKLLQGKNKSSIGVD